MILSITASQVVGITDMRNKSHYLITLMRNHTIFQDMLNLCTVLRGERNRNAMCVTTPASSKALISALTSPVPPEM
jgi:hypothetical protein